MINAHHVSAGGIDERWLEKIYYPIAVRSAGDIGRRFEKEMYVFSCTITSGYRGRAYRKYTLTQRASGVEYSRANAYS